jgi:uncharacterized membrane protein YphA (DoxX/SURF4 family)
MYAGVVWLIYGIAKLPHWLNGDAKFLELTRGMIKTTSGPFHDFIVNAVLPHAQVFSILVACGETLCGISLLLGLFTKVGGIGGMFLTLNYWFAGGQYADIFGVASLEAMLFVISFAAVVLPVNGFFSVDKFMSANSLGSLHRSRSSSR